MSVAETVTASLKLLLLQSVHTPSKTHHAKDNIMTIMCSLNLIKKINKNNSALL